jgi:hypothetical protein
MFSNLKGNYAPYIIPDTPSAVITTLHVLTYTYKMSLHSLDYSSTVNIQAFVDQCTRVLCTYMPVEISRVHKFGPCRFVNELTWFLIRREHAGVCTEPMYDLSMALVIVGLSY